MHLAVQAVFATPEIEFIIFKPLKPAVRNTPKKSRDSTHGIR